MRRKSNGTQRSIEELKAELAQARREEARALLAEVLDDYGDGPDKLIDEVSKMPQRIELEYPEECAESSTVRVNLVSHLREAFNAIGVPNIGTLRSRAAALRRQPSPLCFLCSWG